MFVDEAHPYMVENSKPLLALMRMWQTHRLIKVPCDQVLGPPLPTPLPQNVCSFGALPLFSGADTGEKEPKILKESLIQFWKGLPHCWDLWWYYDLWPFSSELQHSTYTQNKESVINCDMYFSLFPSQNKVTCIFAPCIPSHYCSSFKIQKVYFHFFFAQGMLMES